ncbi:MAG: RNA polymerase sigma factor RpoD/SigA [bacterium]
MGHPSSHEQPVTSQINYENESITYTELSELLRDSSPTLFELEDLFKNLLQNDCTPIQSQTGLDTAALLNPESTSNRNFTAESVQAYYDKIKNHDLLSAEEEHGLFQMKEYYEKLAREAILSTPYAVEQFVDKLEEVRGEDRSIKNLVDISKVESVSPERESELFEELNQLAEDLKEIGSILERTATDLTSSEHTSSYCVQNQRYRLLKVFGSVQLDTDLMEGWLTDLLQQPDRANLPPARQAPCSALLEFLDFARHLYRDRIVVRNLRLVFSLLDQFSNRGLPDEDLIQEGNLGLFKAIEKFDHEKGYKFSTYATWWIRQAMQRALHDQRSLIRLPSHRREQLTKLFSAMSELKQDLQRKPEPEEIAKKLNWPQDKVKTLLKIDDQPLSLHEDNGPSDDRTLEDVLSDPSSLDFEQAMEESQLTQSLNETLGELPWRKEQIIRMRYGLDQEKKQTFRTIADLMNLSKERVRQLEQDALDELREKFQADSVRDLS